MAFVNGFDCDVFVSYATANNQEIAPGKPGWVTSFRDVLKKLLDEGLDRRNASEVWMDYKLRGNEPFDEQLRETVSKSAVLLIVLSDAYLASPWCRKELEIFLETTHNGVSRSGCIFLVHYEPVLIDRWPGGLRGLSNEKYRFFQQERDGAPSRPLGFPIPNPENPAHQGYYDRLLDLRSELSQHLEKMGKPPAPKAASVPTASTPDVALAPCVYLAEVAGDTLYEQRRLARSHLEQVGLQVLPTKTYARAPEEYARELDRDLAGCPLFVQMLGRFPSGYEKLQHERAVAGTKEILRWRSRDLVLDDVPDPEHRKLLDGVDVKVMDFDELKRTIVERMRILSIKPAPAMDGERFVLINAVHEDSTVADEITRQLESWQVGYDVVNGDVPLRDLADANVYDALLVIYGQCPHEWVRQQLMKCREILLSRKTRAPACAVYIGPPDGKEPLRCRPPRVSVIDRHEASQLQAFINKLSAAGVAP
ncbi:MAG: toll/interleukin-1 receptor domain-containing protein [Planctomycetes bacterium]|nr:toll/interleukin-1 receptor domain-containing protein [Planctomycetota bacterium]